MVDKPVIRWMSAVCGLLMWLAGSGASLANGWEHGAVPFEVLIEALESEDAEIRGRAATSLGYRGQKEASAALLALLSRGEPDPGVRAGVFAALGRLGAESAFVPLTECLKSEGIDTVRAECALALGDLGDERAVSGLIAVLDAHPASIVKSRVVEALGHFSKAEAIDRLAAIAAGSDRSLRDRAVRALGNTGTPAAAAPLLESLENAQDDRQRLLIVDALGRIRAKSATSALQALLDKSENPLLRARCAVALGAIRDGSAVPSLVKLLDDPSPGVQLYAIQALRELGRREAALPVKRLANRLLARLESPHDPPAADRVVAELSLLDLALRAVTELDPGIAFDTLVRAARRRPVTIDSEAGLAKAEGIYEVRRRALYGLGYTEQEKALAILLGDDGIGDPDPRLRAVSARSLGVIGSIEATSSLAALLKDTDPEVRWTAAMVLGRMGAAPAIDPLMRNLDDDYAEVRRQAALALGYLRATAAREPLRRAEREDPSGKVRAAARHALHLIEQHG